MFQSFYCFNPPVLQIKTDIFANSVDETAHNELIGYTLLALLFLCFHRYPVRINEHAQVQTGKSTCQKFGGKKGEF